MKQLKSTYQELRELFDKQIKIQHITEELQFCNSEELSENVRCQTKFSDFDVIGLETDGRIDGFICKSEIREGPVKNYKKPFTSFDVVDGSLPLIEVLSALRDSPNKFVIIEGEVKGIVTRGDLQKTPVRMWLFGIINLLEMHLLRIIKTNFKGDEWCSCLKESRIKQAEKIHNERKRRNEELDLNDCLQLCDKIDLVLKIPTIEKELEEFGKSKKRKLKSIESLRNKLFHAQDIVMGSSWVEIIDLIINIESLLEFFENKR